MFYLQIFKSFVSSNFWDIQFTQISDSQEGKMLLSVIFLLKHQRILDKECIETMNMR